jgi:hypothetical protein
MKNVQISQVDAVFEGGSYPIEFLFYLVKGIDSGKMGKALRLAAPLFWPVFGRYQHGRIWYDGYREEEHFWEETVPEAFDPAGVSENPLDTRRRFTLEDTGGLFFLKILHFKNGSVLIPKMSHLAGDGYSYFYFLSALAALARTGRWHPSSFLYRTVFRPTHSRTAVRKFSWEGGEPAAPSGVSDLKIDVERIPKIKVKQAADEISASAQRRVSSNDLLSAKVLRKIVELKPDGFGQRVRLTFPMDVRRAVRKLGPRFFGNGILFHHMEWPREEILRLRPEELAVEIRKAQPHLNEDAFRRFLEKMEVFIKEKKKSALRPFDPETGCLVTNISRLPADKLNFGRGAPALIAPLTVEKNSAGILSGGEDFVLQIVY